MESYCDTVLLVPSPIVILFVEIFFFVGASGSSGLSGLGISNPFIIDWSKRFTSLGFFERLLLPNVPCHCTLIFFLGPIVAW